MTNATVAMTSVASGNATPTRSSSPGSPAWTPSCCRRSRTACMATRADLAVLRSRSAPVDSRTQLIEHGRGRRRIAQLATARYPETIRLRKIDGVGAITSPTLC